MDTPTAPQSGTTSLSDILSAIKNLVLAVNGLTQTYLNVQGLANTAEITALTVVKAGAGRLCRVSVLVAGSTVGSIYDGASLSAPTTENIYVIPNTVGVYDVNIPCGYGILVAPGAGQNVTVSWS
jgi:hypothetical protein